MRSCPRRKSASWTAPSAAPGGRSIPSPGSRKAAKPTAEAKPGIGSVTFTNPIPGHFIRSRCTTLSLSVMINRPIIPVEPAPKDCFSILIREPLRHHTAVLRQHRTMGAAAFDGSFAPPAQFEKWEIHPVFPHFPNFRLGQNLSSKALAPLCGVALSLDVHNTKKKPDNPHPENFRRELSEISQKALFYGFYPSG